MLLPLLATILLAPDTTFNTYCMDCHGDGLAKGDWGWMNSSRRPESTTRTTGWLCGPGSVTGTCRRKASRDPRRPNTLKWNVGVRTHRDIGRRSRRSRSHRAASTEQRRGRAATIQDLFDVTIDTEDRFSADGAGEGFDTTADVLTLPPLLLEKYFDAAELVRDAPFATRISEWIERTVSLRTWRRPVESRFATRSSG